MRRNLYCYWVGLKLWLAFRIHHWRNGSPRITLRQQETSIL